MSITIFKYILKETADYRGHEEHIKINIPCLAEILKVDECEGKLVVWALVDISLSLEARHFVIYRDEQAMLADHGHYCGTVQMNGGKVVFHVFDKNNIS